MPHDRSTRPELVEGHVDARVPEIGECRLETLRLDGRLDVGERAAGHAEQPEVRAVRMREHPTLDHGQKVATAIRHPVVDDGVRFVERHTSTKEPAQTREEASVLPAVAECTSGFAKDHEGGARGAPRG